MIPLHDDNPTRTTPFITVTIIIACGLAFFWQLSLGEHQQAGVVAFGFIPAVFFDHTQLPPALALIPAWTTILSSMFLHGGWMHLIGNMLYLWIFGNNVEDAMGHTRFILFYLLCGIVAAMAQALPNPESTVPMIGASGAISGVLGAYLLLYPRAKVLVMIPLGFYITTMRLPAGAVLAFWFVFQILSTLLSAGQEGGVAWGAHIGGFIAGILLIPLFKHRNAKFFTPARTR
ncbi:MAG: rhomboid family intramembrane serine protease [Gammaproteobacteria bacterium]|nr:rhomboid family intramembrane serine protease [Gammaproteobacteria bacterium]